MKLNLDRIDDYEVDVVGEVGETGKLEIDINHLDIWFEMMSKGIYSNPHGSIIRELVSNLFDSHKEWEDKKREELQDDSYVYEKAVVVGARKEESEWYMFFEDFGVGISPDRFHRIYRKYLASTKRDTNELIGGFGLGSKSPLSYTDCFYVRTRFDGTEWLYVISKGADGKPEFDVMYNVPTTEGNGTEVKFIIEGGRYSDDWYIFEGEIKSQLKYFDGVYVKEFNVENEYNIYEFDTFKFRADTKERKMHVVLGQVTYPIDWNTLKREEINIPVGVKFDIGEIMVTTNREQIRYSGNVVETINAKIDLCLEELKKLSCFAFDDLKEYLTWRESPTKQIVTEICKIPVYEGYYGSDGKGNYIKYPFQIDGYYKRIGKMPIVIPENPFFFLKVKGIISSGSYSTLKENSKSKRYYENVFKLSQSYKLYRDGDFKPNALRNAYIRDGIVVVKDNISISDWIRILGLGKISYGRRKKVSDRVPIAYGYNRLKLIQHYRKVMIELFMEKSLHYSKMEIPADFLSSWKEKKGVKKRAALEGQILALDVSSQSSTKSVFSFKDLNEGLIVYGTNKTKNYLKAVYQIVKTRYKKKSFIVINENEVKLMEGDNKLDLFTYVSKSNKFREQITAFYLYKRWQRVEINYLRRYIPALNIHIEEFEGFMKKTTSSDYRVWDLVDNKFVKEVIDMAKEEGYLIKEWIEKLECLEEIQEDLSVLKEINKDANDRTIRDITKFILSKGYPVNHELLYNPTKAELRWKITYEAISDKTIYRAGKMWRRGPYGINHSVNNLKTIVCPRTNFLKLEENKSVKISMLQLQMKMEQ